MVLTRSPLDPLSPALPAAPFGGERRKQTNMALLSWRKVKEQHLKSWKNGNCADPEAFHSPPVIDAQERAEACTILHYLDLYM